MKKIWSFILCLVISLTMTSVCLASDGADLNKQQQAVVKVFAALNGQNGMEYAGIRQLMSAKLQTELDEKTFGSVKNNLRRSYGEQRENRFLAYQRYADGDRLAYLAKYSKEKALLFIFVFDKNSIVFLIHFLITDLFNHGVWIDPSRASLIDTFLQKHRILIRFSCFVCGNAHFFFPDLYLVHLFLLLSPYSFLSAVR